MTQEFTQTAAPTSVEWETLQKELKHKTDNDVLKLFNNTIEPHLLKQNIGTLDAQALGYHMDRFFEQCNDIAAADPQTELDDGALERFKTTALTIFESELAKAKKAHAINMQRLQNINDGLPAALKMTRVKKIKNRLKQFWNDNKKLSYIDSDRILGNSYIHGFAPVTAGISAVGFIASGIVGQFMSMNGWMMAALGAGAGVAASSTWATFTVAKAAIEKSKVTAMDLAIPASLTLALIGGYFLGPANETIGAEHAKGLARQELAALKKKYNEIHDGRTWDSGDREYVPNQYGLGKHLEEYKKAETNKLYLQASTLNGGELIPIDEAAVSPALRTQMNTLKANLKQQILDAEEKAKTEREDVVIVIEKLNELARRAMYTINSRLPENERKVFTEYSIEANLEERQKDAALIAAARLKADSIPSTPTPAP